MLLVSYVNTWGQDPARGKNEAVVSLTFDDGCKTVYTAAFPILEEYGLVGVNYVIADRLDKETGNYLNVEQLGEMAEAGWETASHSKSHQSLVEMSQEEMEMELRKSKKFLQDFGFTVENFATPFGHWDETVQELASKYYRSLRNTEKGYNDFEDPDYYNLKIKPVFDWTSVHEARGWIDQANNKGSWLILTFHSIDSSDNTYSMEKEALEEIVKYVHEENVRVATVTEVLDDLEYNCQN